MCSHHLLFTDLPLQQPCSTVIIECYIVNDTTVVLYHNFSGSMRSDNEMTVDLYITTSLLSFQDFGTGDLERVGK